MFEFLLDPEFLERWGYLAVFVVSALEAIPFVGLLVPGQLVVIFGGVLANQGLLDVRRLIVAAVVGGLVGQAIGYTIGRRIGRPLLDRFGPRFRITEKEIDKTEALFRKHGLWAVFLGHFSFLTRGLVNLMAGVSRYPPQYFVPVTAAAVIVWSVGYTALGFVFGAAWHRVAALVGNATLALFALIGLTILVWWTIHALRVRARTNR